MVIKISNEKILESFNKASKDIKVILSSEIIKEEVLEIIKDLKPVKEKEELFFREIVLVTLNLALKKDLIERIENIFSISTKKATEIVKIIDRVFFERIRVVKDGISSEYLNIDNNIDHFSNSTNAYELELPEELEKKIDSNVNYTEYEFNNSIRKNI